MSGLSHLTLSLSLVAAITRVGATARAQDRDQGAKTPWVSLAGADAPQLAAKQAEGYRLVDLEVERTSPLRFSGVLVLNEGPFRSRSWWYYGKTEAQVAALLAQNNARLVDLETYVDGGARRFAVVMVPNTGAQAKTWWWYTGLTPTLVAQRAATNGARVTHLASYVDAGVQKYAAIMVRNAGADAQTWWQYFGLNSAQVSAKLALHNARLTDIERAADGTFAVLMRPTSGEAWWWYIGMTMDALVLEASRNGARVFDVEPYVVGDKTYFAGVMIGQSNALETRLATRLRGATDGRFGVYLKEVGGPVLAGLSEDYAFEPASGIKVLHLLAAMEAVQSGSLTLTKLVPVCMDGSAAGCPNTLATCTSIQNTQLSAVLTPMMQNSDNRATQAIRELLGEATINDVAADLGLDATFIQHTVGCGAEMAANHNRTSLADLGQLHETAATGLLNASIRNSFYGFMSNGSNALTTLINEEGAALGKSAGTIAAFRGKVRNSWKGGSYGWNGLLWRSYFGETSLPFKVAGVVVPREFVHGAFIDSAANITDDSIIVLGVEALREKIREAFSTW